MADWAGGDAAFELAPAPLAVVDAFDGEVLAVNRALALRLDAHPDRLVGLTWPTPLGGTRKDFVELYHSVDGDRPVVLDRRLGDRIDPVWWRQTIVRVEPDGGDPYLIIQIEDRTREHHITRELTRAADHDDLTGLWNRRTFRRHVRSLLAAPRPEPVGVVLFDVDGFKEVNDSFGHSVGDAALLAVADALRGAAPAGAGVARLSGDEFAVVLSGSDAGRIADDCAQLASRTRRITMGDGLPVVELSAGWAVGTSGLDVDDRVDNLMIEADVAMYASKAQRKAQREASFGPADDEVDVAGVWPPGDVVEEVGYELWSHPVIDAATGSVSMHDVSLHGSAVPVTLTALVRILEMVQRHAARQVGQPASYVVHLRDFPLGVGSAVKWLGRAAHDAGIAPGSVTFALPENRLLDAGRSSNRVLASLRDEGFGLGIDAFGADVGSLRLIGDLDPDQIWIDRNLVVGTGGAAAAEGRRGADLDLVEATVTVGRRTGALVGVAGLAPEEVPAAAALGIDLALVPDTSALRPVGVVAVEGALRSVSVEAARPRAGGSTTGS